MLAHVCCPFYCCGGRCRALITEQALGRTMTMEEIRELRRKAFSGYRMGSIPDNRDAIAEGMRDAGVPDYDIDALMVLIEADPGLFALVEEPDSDPAVISSKVSSIARRNGYDYTFMNMLFKDALQGTGEISSELDFPLCIDVSDVDDDVKDILKRAEEGDAACQYEIGMRFRRGDGVFEDDDESFRWLLKSAEQGYADAMFEMGVCFELGIGAPIDDYAADTWFRKARDAGHKEAGEWLD